MDYNGYAQILRDLGRIDGRLAGIERQQVHDFIRIGHLALQVDRLQRTERKPVDFWRLESFWLKVAAAGALLGGSPEIAKGLLKLAGG